MARVLRERLFLLGLLPTLLGCGRVGIQLTDAEASDAGGPDEGGMLVDVGVGPPPDDGGPDGSGLLADASADDGGADSFG